MNIDHITKETLNGSQLNLDALYKIAPSCFTEAKGEDGIVRKVVDFAKLRLLLGDNAVEDAPEVYDFTWVGKRAAMREAAAPIGKTLRPSPEESVDWDTTQNLYIEGDNLEVLKMLQNSYMGKVKMIYIDPPYNTGNDFVYHDNFTESAEEYEENNRDEEGNRYRRNSDSNGRFHSDWCSMIYARLKISRSLLTDDGVIFISIDDSEQGNLKKICDEVFGEMNFINTVVWEKRYSPQNAVQWFSENHDFVLVYAKDKMSWHPELLERTAEMNARYSNRDNDPRGPWKAVDATAQGGHGTQSQFYVFTAPNGKVHHLPSGRCWLYTEKVMAKMIEDNRIWFGEDGNNMPSVKRFLTEVKQGVACQTIWKYEEVGHSQDGKKELKKLFPEGIPFDTPKPSTLIKRMLKLSSGNDFLTLDFFSGSATTAHAVMQLNSEDGGHRKFIMVQWPEETPADSEAAKAGYKNICEIGKERIRRAGKKIKEDSPLTTQDLDTGFRVFKCDESNYKEVAFTPNNYSQESLELFVDNIKEDRSDLDLLFDCMLRWGVELSMPMKKTTVEDCTIHNVDDGNLVACFDGMVTEKVIDAIASMNPLRIVFRDSSFTEASTKMNLYELFKQKCGWSETEVKNNIRVI